VGGGLIETAGFPVLFITGALFSLVAGALLFLKKIASVAAAQEESSEVGQPAVAAVGNMEEK
jgi:hypothetical protein